jgi:hypothetical protein
MADTDMSITEKTAYIKGLIEGLSLDQDKPETKVLTAVVDALNQIASEVAELSDEVERVGDYLDELDHDLGDLESDYYECDEDEDDDEDWDGWALDEEEDEDSFSDTGDFGPIMFDEPAGDGNGDEKK